MSRDHSSRQENGLQSAAILRRYLWLSSAVVLPWTILLGRPAADQLKHFGVISTDRWVGLVLGTLIVLVTPLATHRLRGWRPAKGRPFWRIPGYYRWLAVVNFSCLLGVVFGSRNSPELLRLSLHLFGVMLFHRVLLCFPKLIQVAVLFCTEKRALRVLDLALTNLVFALILTELAAHGFLSLQGKITWFPTPVDVFASRDRQSSFGIEPNRLGCNDDEFEERKAPGVFRIVAIGDSFFFGHVPRPFGVIARTEALLKESVTAAKSGSRVEIYNFSQVAIGPVEYQNILIRHAMKYQPDLVVVGFYVGNDVKAGYRPPTPLNKRWYALYQMKEEATRRRRLAKAVAREQFVDLTRITRTDREFWYSPDGPPPVSSREKYLKIARRHLELCRLSSDASRAQAWLSSLSALRQMKKACDAAGVPMALVINPDHVQVSPSLRQELRERFSLDLCRFDLSMPQRRLVEFCREQHIPCLDLTAVFNGASNPDSLYLLNDTHWSAQGNDYAARALATWIERWLAER